MRREVKGCPTQKRPRKEAGSGQQREPQEEPQRGHGQMSGQKSKPLPRRALAAILGRFCPKPTTSGHRTKLANQAAELSLPCSTHCHLIRRTKRRSFAAKFAEATLTLETLDQHALGLG